MRTPIEWVNEFFSLPFPPMFFLLFLSPSSPSFPLLPNLTTTFGHFVCRTRVGGTEIVRGICTTKYCYLAFLNKLYAFFKLLRLHPSVKIIFVLRMLPNAGTGHCTVHSVVVMQAKCVFSCEWLDKRGLEKGS